jgi:type 1 glutamine amidotransferase
VENKNHPITAGVEDYDIFDEQHMSKYDLDQEHLLLRSVAPDNAQAAAGWWNEFGKGRMCYLSPGHTVDAISHPMTQLLLRNAMRWLLHENDKVSVTISRVQ